MTSEEIRETVEKSGEMARQAAEGYEPEQKAAEWMQVKMLAEIALQLAVMNDRATPAPAAVASFLSESFCDAPRRLGGPWRCWLKKGHAGDHMADCGPWTDRDTVDPEKNILSQTRPGTRIADLQRHGAGKCDDVGAPTNT